MAKEIKRQDGKILAYPVADGEEIEKGQMVVLNDSGKLEVGADSADKKFAGFAVEPAGEQGYVRVFKTGVFEVELDDGADAVAGDEVYLVDEETVTEADADTSESISVGFVAEAGDVARVRIDRKVN